MQSRGAGRATLPLRPLGEDPSSPLPASGSPMHSLESCSTAVLSSHGCHPSVSMSTFPSSGKDTSHVVLGLTLMTLF